jgi:hypothetical protein
LEDIKLTKVEEHQDVTALEGAEQSEHRNGASFSAHGSSFDARFQDVDDILDRLTFDTQNAALHAV